MKTFFKILILVFNRIIALPNENVDLYMKRLSIITVSICLFVSFFIRCSKSGGSNMYDYYNPDTSVKKPTVYVGKKGFGLNETIGFNYTQLNLLSVNWYYNWGLTTKANSNKSFIPMVFSGSRVAGLTFCDTLLGFNEPDNASQSNMPVSSAIGYWPSLVSNSNYLGSPSMAGNPVTSSWFIPFMQSKTKVDFITFHWYKGADTAKFYSDVQSFYSTYKKPIWVTEYACQTEAESTAKPNAYTQNQVNQFIIATTRWMNNQSFIQKYAWHDSKVGTSAFFDSIGHLTASGQTYAGVQ